MPVCACAVGLPTGGSMDLEDHTDSSQETFEMLGGARKKKLTGKSLHKQV